VNAIKARSRRLGIQRPLIMDQLKESAEGGNEYSQFYLGLVLENQLKNDDALIWYRKASDQGLRNATDAVDRLSTK
jgi:TPR repeat protein